MPTISSAGGIVEAWLEATLFYEYGLYPGEETSLRVTDLGQASKDSIIVDRVGPRPPVDTKIWFVETRALKSKFIKRNPRHSARIG